MNVLTKRVARAFRRSKESYHKTALAQRDIAENLFGAYRRLAPEHFPRRIVEAGYGTGYLTEHLLSLNPENVWLNDLSAGSLPGVDAVYLPGDIADIALPQDVDLVASASMIQWVSDPHAVIGRLCDAVAAEGYLAISGFSPDHFPELQALGSQAGAPSYWSGERMADALPPGWRVCGLGTWRILCHFPSALTVLKHLRETGVNACSGQFRTPAAIQDFLKRYEEAYRNELGVPLTYVASWLVAKKC